MLVPMSASRSIQSLLLRGALCMALHAAHAADLGKYQLILDKELFGSADRALVKKPTRPPPAPSPSWARDYTMTMMTYDQDKNLARIGLQNLRDETALLLIEGDTSHPDFQLLSADYRRGLATVKHRGVDHQFSLEDGPARKPSTPSRGSASSRPTRRDTRRVIANPRSTPNIPEPVSTPVPPVRFESGEELREHLKQVQMDALRSGKPPLPIPLTPEMDDQLVNEGVLPPRNAE